MIYLDTHVIVWLYQKETQKFSEQSMGLIENNDLYISPFVNLEIEYLFEVNRITEHAQTIINYLIKKIDLKICDLPFMNVVSEAILMKWTRDPFDRIITAHAYLNDATLITKDKTIQKNYDKSVW